MKYTNKTTVYLTRLQQNKLEQRSKELGYRQISKYVRRLIVEGLKHNYTPLDPDNFENTNDTTKQT
jgi:hypothetical protein